MNQLLEHQSLAQRVVQEIKQQIETGALRPRQRITEVELAAQLGISRAPVREALRTLVDQGLVIHLARRGYRVGWLTSKSVKDTYKTRRALECLAIEQIVQKNDPTLLENLAHPIHDMGRCLETGDVKALIRSDLEFHQALIVASGNEVSLSAYRLITSLTLPALNLLVPYELRELHVQNEEYLREHRAVLDALTRNDAGEAARLASDHLEKAMNTVLALMARVPNGDSDEPTKRSREQTTD